MRIIEIHNCYLGNIFESGLNEYEAQTLILTGVAMTKAPTKLPKRSYFEHVRHLAKSKNFATQADADEKKALAIHSRASALRDLAAYHKNLATAYFAANQTIYETDIMKRFYAAVGEPNISWTTKISAIDPSGTNPLQYMCDICDNYPSFKADGLNLSLPDLGTATTVGDVITAIVKDYEKRDWHVVMAS
jgi:hypothetical protein